jgi:hypothetical protein
MNEQKRLFVNEPLFYYRKNKNKFYFPERVYLSKTLNY